MPNSRRGSRTPPPGVGYPSRTRFSAASRDARTDSGAVPIAVRMLLIGSFPLALFAVGALSRGDRARVAGLLQQRSAARRRPHEPDEVAVDDQRLADEEPTP